MFRMNFPQGFGFSNVINKYILGINGKMNSSLDYILGFLISLQLNVNRMIYIKVLEVTGNNYSNLLNVGWPKPVREWLYFYMIINQEKGKNESEKESINQ